MKKRISVVEKFIDVTAPSTVEITIKRDGSVVWVDVDGVCRLRACRVQTVVLKDERRKASVRYNQEG